jgi:hypothetical protein
MRPNPTRRGLMCWGLTKRGLMKQGLMKRGLMKRGLMRSSRTIGPRRAVGSYR